MLVIFYVIAFFSFKKVSRFQLSQPNLSGIKMEIFNSYSVSFLVPGYKSVFWVDGFWPQKGLESPMSFLTLTYHLISVCKQVVEFLGKLPVCHLILLILMQTKVNKLHFESSISQI